MQSKLITAPTPLREDSAQEQRGESRASGAPSFLSHAEELITAGSTYEGMRELIAGLGEAYWTMSDSEWRRFVRDVVRQAPVFALTRQDPLTERSLSRPRGYPGDAVMLDMLYRRHELAEPPTGVGRAVMEFTTARSDASSAVRWRKSLLAHYIDEAVVRFSKPRVVSIACGHLRELEIARAARDGSLGEIVGLDFDPKSLAATRILHHAAPLTAKRCSVRRILSGATPLGEAHLVYAAGLFDYLETSVAELLVRRMAEATVEAGALLIGNFLHGIGDAGYMSAMMDWQLIYRSEEEFDGLFDHLDRTAFPNVHFFNDPLNYIRYALVQRRP